MHLSGRIESPLLILFESKIKQYCLTCSDFCNKNLSEFTVFEVYNLQIPKNIASLNVTGT